MLSFNERLSRTSDGKAFRVVGQGTFWAVSPSKGRVETILYVLRADDGERIELEAPEQTDSWEHPLFRRHGVDLRFRLS